MSQENVEVVRAIYRAFDRGATPQLMSLLDPEIDFLINPAAPETGTHHGHEGIRSWLGDIEETLSEFDIAPGEFLDAGEHVVCSVRVRVVGKGSGAEVELRETHLWTMSEGKAARMQAYPVHDEALQAAGLRD
jgi:ketosteroid isomerase-like protein